LLFSFILFGFDGTFKSSLSVGELEAKAFHLGPSPVHRARTLIGNRLTGKVFGGG